jgi:hypothetical protein
MDFECSPEASKELARQEIPLEQLKATAKETQEGENPLPGDEGIQ